jgi:CheY-like chemotaxis protein
VAASLAPVLVVDDDAGIRDALVCVLAVGGYDAVTAEDGLDGLAYLRTGGRPSVIILDMFMPNMDGPAFQRALKADPRWAGIPVVIFSAFPPADPGDAIGVVAKGSADPDALLALVARACATSVPARAI